MMLCKRFMFLTLTVISSVSFAQKKDNIGTVRFHLKEKGFYRWVKDKNVRVNVNDTLEKPLISDRKGYTGFLELPPGEYNLTVDVDHYKPVSRKVKVIRGEGKTLKVKMRKGASNKKPD